MQRWIVACALLLALGGTVSTVGGSTSATGRTTSRSTHPGQPAVTADQLISVVFPERRDDPDTGATVYGPTAIPVRRIDSTEEPEILDGVTELGSSLMLTIPDGAATRHVLYLEIEGELVNDFTPFRGQGALVAIVEAGPSRRILDLVDVKTDRESDVMWGGPASRLGPTACSFTVTSEHHNSSQNYESFDMLTVQDGRIRPVLSLNLLSWGTETENVTESASFRVVPRRGSPYGDVVVSVKVERSPYSGSTARRRVRHSVRTYRETYRWRGPERGYEDAGGNLDFVVELNAAHY